MSQISYKTEIGGYNEDVQCSVTLVIKGGVDKEDYETLRKAFQTIEDLAYKYQTTV